MGASNRLRRRSSLLDFVSGAKRVPHNQEGRPERWTSTEVGRHCEVAPATKHPTFRHSGMVRRTRTSDAAMRHRGILGFRADAAPIIGAAGLARDRLARNDGGQVQVCPRQPRIPPSSWSRALLARLEGSPHATAVILRGRRRRGLAPPAITAEAVYRRADDFQTQNKKPAARTAGFLSEVEASPASVRQDGQQQERPRCWCFLIMG